MRLPSGFTYQQRFTRQVALPIAAILAVVTALAWFGLQWACERSDAVSVSRQIRVTEHALSESIDELAYQQQTSASWTLLHQMLDRPRPDQAWLDENIGRWMYRIFGHEAVFLLDGNDRPIYASVRGRRLPLDEYARYGAYLAPLVDGVRGRRTSPPSVHDRRPGGIVAPASTALTRKQAVHETDLIEIAGRPAAASAMVISRTDGSAPGPRPFVMVNFRYLDGAFLDQISRRELIAGLGFTHLSEAKPGEAEFPLIDEAGHRVGFIRWRPELPGRQVRQVVGPVAAAVVIVLAVTLLALARSLWRAGDELTSTMLQLSDSERAAQQIASHDQLTGLANRWLFHRRLDATLAHGSAGSVAVLALDLDRFKHVNDSLGHHAGDLLIRELGARLGAIVRPSDTVARIGGDEFMVLLDGIGDGSAVDEVCARILTAADTVFELPQGDAFIGVSIGVAVSALGADSRAEMLRRSDIALYQAKADGRSCWRYFTQAMDERVRSRSEMEDELRAALHDPASLQVHYQPEVDRRGQIVGLEALVRWQHPAKGLVSPEQFVPVAEETGLIHALGDHVLREACRVARQWPALFVAVNLSPRQIQASGFADRVARIVQAAGCDPRQIELEITEGVLLDNSEVARACIDQLRAAGFRIALDDFGTGYSSLIYLKQFKVDKIKIDRSFTQSIGRAGDAAAIVTSVVTLGHAMGLTVTAEGVETHEQREFLAAAGCNEMQGFFFSRAVPEERVATMLRETQRCPLAA